MITISKDEAERARLMSEWKHEMDLQSKMVQAKREGRRQEKSEIAAKMKKRGTPIDQIAEDTGLSADEIAVL
ncbi:MAG: hypothetical protein LBU16_06455 [Treponema sp.]|jgi:predicted transposase/invertase (TIGR01784 family)|nr:hypothetical protein [Treponema sp.]